MVLDGSDTLFAERYRRPHDRLQFVCISMPPWPGDEEATVIEGAWEPNTPDG